MGRVVFGFIQDWLREIHPSQASAVAKIIKNLVRTLRWQRPSTSPGGYTLPGIWENKQRYRRRSWHGDRVCPSATVQMVWLISFDPNCLLVYLATGRGIGEDVDLNQNPLSRFFEKALLWGTRCFLLLFFVLLRFCITFIKYFFSPLSLDTPSLTSAQILLNVFRTESSWKQLGNTHPCLFIARRMLEVMKLSKTSYDSKMSRAEK